MNKFHECLGAPLGRTVMVPIAALGLYLATGEAFWALGALFVVSATATVIRVAQGRESLTMAWRGGLLGMSAWLAASLIESGGHVDDAALFSSTALLFAAAGFVAEILFPRDNKGTPVGA